MRTSAAAVERRPENGLQPKTSPTQSALNEMDQALSNLLETAFSLRSRLRPVLSDGADGHKMSETAAAPAPIEISGQIIYHLGHIQEIHGILRDISDRLEV